MLSVLIMLVNEHTEFMISAQSQDILRYQVMNTPTSEYPLYSLMTQNPIITLIYKMDAQQAKVKNYVNLNITVKIMKTLLC